MRRPEASPTCARAVGAGGEPEWNPFGPDAHGCPVDGESIVGAHFRAFSDAEGMEVVIFVPCRIQTNRVKLCGDVIRCAVSALGPDGSTFEAVVRKIPDMGHRPVHPLDERGGLWAGLASEATDRSQ